MKSFKEIWERKELDEISPKLARKAAAMSVAKGYEYGQGGDDDDELDRLDRKSDKAMAHVKKRQGAKGIRKTNRLANKAIFGRSRAFATEDIQDEKRMMRQQLMFIAYAAKEITAYVDRVADPEEWYQNKMATTHSMMKTLYSYAQGQMQSMNADDDLMAGYYGEEITKLDARRREFKEKLRKLAYEKYGKKKVDAVDKAELDEETWKEIEAYAKKHGGIDKKDMLKVAMMLKKGDRKGAEKYARGLETDPRDWLLDKMDETLEEANFKPGSLKLNDGSKVKISMDDAKAITAVMKTLSTKNRKEMETRMMADKKGFDEIMAFVDAAGM